MTTASTYVSTFVLPPSSEHAVLLAVCGACDTNITQIEQALTVSIAHRGNRFHITGTSHAAVDAAEHVLTQLAEHTERPPIVTTLLQHVMTTKNDPSVEPIRFRVGKRTVSTKGAGQKAFISTLRENVITFAIGPAGCGKTWLSIAEAMRALDAHEVRKVVLCRPAVEAGEKLGFLPGDINEKIHPFLQPLYDALFALYARNHVEQRFRDGTIEIVPLAYMRGRTLSDAFLIVDEAQNATKEQVKMIVTRIGLGSKMVFCGDVLQSDLPKSMPSGLLHAVKILEKLPDIGVVRLDSRSIVRHPIIGAVLAAYERGEKIPAP